MIKVLHVVSSMNRGGLETFIMNLYRNIDRSKVRFDFLVHTDKNAAFDEEIHSLGGKIFSIPSREHGLLKNRKALNDFFRVHSEYKVIHQHVSSLSYVEPLKAAKKYKVPVRIVHSHSTRQGGSSLHKYLHKWNQFFVKSYATHYFACSDLAAKWLYGEKQYRAGDFTLINNGIDTEKFMFNEETRKIVRKELEVDNKFVLGHIGRFMYPKNHEFLIDIFKDFHEKEPNSILLLVGDGGLRDKIEEKVNYLGLQNSVIFTGIRYDIPYLLQAMDVFIMPSHYEGFPVTLVEAQASGVLCFVSDNITKQVSITNLINYISLKSTSNDWANIVFEKSNTYKRRDFTQLVKKNGFDSKVVAEEIMNIYLGRVEEVQLK